MAAGERPTMEQLETQFNLSSYPKIEAAASTDAAATDAA